MRRRFEPIPDPAGALVPPPRYPRTAVGAATPLPPRGRSEDGAFQRQHVGKRRPRRRSRAARAVVSELLHGVADVAGMFARAASDLAERIAPR
jgi:hypothetical protein